MVTLELFIDERFDSIRNFIEMPTKDTFKDCEIYLVISIKNDFDKFVNYLEGGKKYESNRKRSVTILIIYYRNLI